MKKIWLSYALIALLSYCSLCRGSFWRVMGAYFRFLLAVYYVGVGLKYCYRLCGFIRFRLYRLLCGRRLYDGIISITPF
jgi:hypothetical protein